MAKFTEWSVRVHFKTGESCNMYCKDREQAQYNILLWLDALKNKRIVVEFQSAEQYPNAVLVEEIAYMFVQNTKAVDEIIVEEGVRRKRLQQSIDYGSEDLDKY